MYWCFFLQKTNINLYASHLQLPDPRSIHLCKRILARHHTALNSCVYQRA